MGLRLCEFSFLLLIREDLGFVEIFLFFIFLLFRATLQHMLVPRLGVELKLQLPAYTTAKVTWDLSCICSLYHSWIPNPLNEARDGTHILMDTSWVRHH